MRQGTRRGRPVGGVASARHAGRRAAGDCRSAAGEDREGNAGGGGDALRARSPNPRSGPPRRHQQRLCAHPVPDARARFGASRLQRHPRRAVLDGCRRRGAERVLGSARGGRRLRQLRVPERSRLHGLRLPPAVRGSRHAGLRQALHGVRRQPRERRRRLRRGPGQRPGERAARVERGRSERRGLCRNVPRGAARRPVRAEPQHRRHRLQSNRRGGRRGRRAAVHLLRRRRGRGRSPRQRPEPGDAARRDCPHRSARRRGRRALRHSGQQSVSSIPRARQARSGPTGCAIRSSSPGMRTAACSSATSARISWKR